jgi:quinol-cytochrome oxidoreductase complex cytochrome b subunit
MKRHIARALIVGLIFIITYYVFQVLRGMYLTYNYVPDIIKSYDSVDHLQHRVSFGISGDPTRILFEVLGLLLLGMIMYFGVRMIRGKK